MYRSYSVNDMPQPIGVRRGDGRRYENTVHNGGKSKIELHDTKDAERKETDGSQCCEPPETDIACEEPGEPSCIPVCEPPCEPACADGHKRGGLFANLGVDDIIVAAVIIMLLLDDCNDKLLILALGFILFSDFFDGKG